MTTELKQTCPACGYPMDCATGIGHQRSPSPGDVTVCISCGDISLFNDDLSLRTPSPGEMMALQRSTAWRKVSATRRAVLTRSK